MAIHLYKTSSRNRLIYGQHHCSTGRTNIIKEYSIITHRIRKKYKQNNIKEYLF